MPRNNAIDIDAGSRNNVVILANCDFLGECRFNIESALHSGVLADDVAKGVGNKYGGNCRCIFQLYDSWMGDLIDAQQSVDAVVSVDAVRWRKVATVGDFIMHFIA